jgi:hypothetical protein
MYSLIVMIAVTLVTLIIFAYVFVSSRNFLFEYIIRPKSVIDDSTKREANYRKTIFSKESLRKLAPLFILGLICFIFVTYAVYSLEHGPEAKLSKDFILSNTSIKKYFGDIRSVSLSNEESSNEDIGPEGRNGELYFYIAGDKKTGTALVRWKSKGSGVGFKVQSLEVVTEDHKFLPIWLSPKSEQ